MSRHSLRIALGSRDVGPLTGAISAIHKKHLRLVVRRANTLSPQSRLTISASLFEIIGIVATFWRPAISTGCLLIAEWILLLGIRVIPAVASLVAITAVGLILYMAVQVSICVSMDMRWKRLRFQHIYEATSSNTES